MRRAGWVERGERQGNGHSCNKYHTNVPPVHAPDSPSPSRSSSLIILSSRKWGVCPLTRQECFPPLSQRQQQSSLPLPIHPHTHLYVYIYAGGCAESFVYIPTLLNPWDNRITHSLRCSPKCERVSERWCLWYGVTGSLAGSDRSLSVPVALCQPQSEVLHHGPGWAAFGNDCEWALSMGHYSMDSAEAAG